MENDLATTCLLCLIHLGLTSSSFLYFVHISFSACFSCGTGRWY
uniref:Uncharacterized protein n=1 Tax=Anguilla anguilla TaxID=7936 RepID=A0A0E9QRZ9_ANGAN